MRSHFAVLLSALILAAGSSCAGESPDMLAIDAGRLGVIVDQSAIALKLVAPDARLDELGPEAGAGATIFQQLLADVPRFNALLAEACRMGAAEPGLCKGSFLPPWLNDPPDTPHATADLRSMIDAATDAFFPLWKDLCAKGRTLAHDESFCQLE